MNDDTIQRRLLNLIQKKGEVTTDQASETLKTDVKTLMNMSKMLIEARILEVVYTVSGEVKLKPGVEFKKATEEEITNLPTTPAREDTTTNKNTLDDFLQSVKKKISEKKLAKNQQKK